MPVNNDFKDLLRFLNQEKAEYLIVGAYAVIFYTEPRYTKDIDIWVRPEQENARKVLDALKKFGAPVSELTVADLSNPAMMYQLGIEPNRIDILMDVEGLKFSGAWKNRVASRYDNEKIFLLSINDLIKSKKKAGRPQDNLDLVKLNRIRKIHSRKQHKL